MATGSFLGIAGHFCTDCGGLGCRRRLYPGYENLRRMVFCEGVRDDGGYPDDYWGDWMALCFYTSGTAYPVGGLADGIHNHWNRDFDFGHPFLGRHP